MTSTSVFEELSIFDLHYKRARDDSKNIKRGTIYFKDRDIGPYPPIGRIFVLNEGIRKNFHNEFYVEEKYNGYNIRVFAYKYNIFAVTRGGIICPYSTDRIHKLKGVLSAFLKAHPDCTLVGELVDLHNPYMDAPTSYEIQEDVRIVFLIL